MNKIIRTICLIRGWENNHDDREWDECWLRRLDPYLKYHGFFR